MSSTAINYAWLSDVAYEVKLQIKRIREGGEMFLRDLISEKGEGNSLILKDGSEIKISLPDDCQMLIDLFGIATHDNTLRVSGINNFDDNVRRSISFKHLPLEAQMQIIETLMKQHE